MVTGLDGGFGFERGDRVLVTGVGSGIGRACAQIAAAQGLAVDGWDLDGEAAERVAAEIREAGGEATSRVVDITDEGAIAEGMAALGAGPAVPRYLVNNAGPPSSAAMSFAEGIVAGAGSMEAVTRRWLELDPPAMASVVFIASIAGNLTGAANDWYAGGKAAIAGYARRTAVAEAGRLRANAVAPGLTETPRMKEFIAGELGRQMIERIPLHRMGTPEDMGWTVVFLLSPRSAYITGQLVPVDGGLTIAP
jgi:NAD(P)-dependent dehydrogenase (short-subunit alcohol dehydrogenase family)